MGVLIIRALQFGVYIRAPDFFGNSPSATSFVVSTPELEGLSPQTLGCWGHRRNHTVHLRRPADYLSTYLEVQGTSNLVIAILIYSRVSPSILPPSRNEVQRNLN